jgi:hypothetical protein
MTPKNVGEILCPVTGVPCHNRSLIINARNDKIAEINARLEGSLITKERAQDEIEALRAATNSLLTIGEGVLMCARDPSSSDIKICGLNPTLVTMTLDMSIERLKQADQKENGGANLHLA